MQHGAACSYPIACSICESFGGKSWRYSPWTSSIRRLYTYFISAVSPCQANYLFTMKMFDCLLRLIILRTMFWLINHCYFSSVYFNQYMACHLCFNCCFCVVMAVCCDAYIHVSWLSAQFRSKMFFHANLASTRLCTDFIFVDFDADQWVFYMSNTEAWAQWIYSVYIYIYMYICVCVCACMYIYIY